MQKRPDYGVIALDTLYRNMALDATLGSWYFLLKSVLAIIPKSPTGGNLLGLEFGMILFSLVVGESVGSCFCIKIKRDKTIFGI